MDKIFKDNHTDKFVLYPFTNQKYVNGGSNIISDEQYGIITNSKKFQMNETKKTIYTYEDLEYEIDFKTVTQIIPISGIMTDRGGLSFIKTKIVDIEKFPILSTYDKKEEYDQISFTLEYIDIIIKSENNI